MELIPLSPALGLLVVGFDPTNLDAPEWDVLYGALYETHHLLLLRGASLDDRQHVAFAQKFGPIAKWGADQKEFTYISNNCRGGALGPIAASWHFDFAFAARPYEAISLYGTCIPKGGTQTWFANAKAAAADLPDGLKRRLSAMTVRNAIDVNGSEREAGVRVRLSRLDETYPHSLKPALWPHWKTGEPVLCVNQQQTDAILPLDPDESDTLIEKLFDHTYRPENTYVHEWQPDDLIVWDNHALHHGRPEVGTVEARTLRRVSIGETQDTSIYSKAG